MGKCQCEEEGGGNGKVELQLFKQWFSRQERESWTLKNFPPEHTGAAAAGPARLTRKRGEGSRSPSMQAGAFQGERMRIKRTKQKVSPGIRETEKGWVEEYFLPNLLVTLLLTIATLNINRKPWVKTVIKSSVHSTEKEWILTASVEAGLPRSLKNLS